MPTDALLFNRAVTRYLHEFNVAHQQYVTAQDKKSKLAARLRMKHIGHQLTRTEGGLDMLIDVLAQIPTRSPKQDEDLKAYRELQARIKQLQTERTKLISLVENLQTALIQERTDHNETRTKLNRAEEELRALQNRILAASIAFRRMETNIQRYISAVAKRDPQQAMELQRTVMTHNAHNVETHRLEQEIARLRQELQDQRTLAAEIAHQGVGTETQSQQESREAMTSLQKQNDMLKATIARLQTRRHTHMSAPDQMFETPSSHVDDNVSDTARFLVKAHSVAQHVIDVATDWLSVQGDIRFAKFARAITDHSDTEIATKIVSTSIRRAKLSNQAYLACHHLWYVQQLVLNACGAIDLLTRRVCNAETKDCENDLAIDPLISTMYQSFDASEELVSFLNDVRNELADVGASDALFVTEASTIGHTSSALTEILTSHKAFQKLALQSFTDKYIEARQFAMRQKLGPAVHRALALWSTAINRLQHLGYVAESSTNTVVQDLDDASRELLARQDREMEVIKEKAAQSASYLQALATQDLSSLAGITNGLARPWFKTTTTPTTTQSNINNNALDDLHLLVTRMLRELADISPHWLTDSMRPGVQLLFASTVLDALIPESSNNFALKLYYPIIRLADVDLLAAAESVHDVANVLRAHFRGTQYQTQWHRSTYISQLADAATPADQLWQTTAMKLRKGLLDTRQQFVSLGADPQARELVQTAEGVAKYRGTSAVEPNNKQQAIKKLLFSLHRDFPPYDAQQMPNDTQDAVDQRIMIHLRNAVMREWKEMQEQLENVRTQLSQPPAADQDQAFNNFVSIWLTKGLIKDTMHQDMLHRVATLHNMLARNTLVYQRQLRQTARDMTTLRMLSNIHRARIAQLERRLRSEGKALVGLRAGHAAANKTLQTKAHQYEALQATASRAKAAVSALESMPAAQDTPIIEDALQSRRENDDNLIRFNQMTLGQLEKQKEQAQTPEHVEHIAKQLEAVRQTIEELEREKAEDSGRDYESEQIARQALATAANLKTMLASVNAELDQIEREKHDLVNREQTARTRAETQAAKIQVLEKELSQAKDTLANERSQVHKEINTAVEKVLANLIPADSAKLQQLEDKLKIYNEMVKKQRAEYIDEELRLKEEITKLTSQREAAEKTNSDDARKLNERISELERQLNTLHTSVEDKNVDVSKLRTELEKRNAEITKLTAEKENIQATEPNTDDKPQKLKELEQKILFLQETNADLQHRIDAAETTPIPGSKTQELEIAQRDLETAKTAFQRAQEAVETYDTAVAKLASLKTLDEITQFISDNNLPTTQQPSQNDLKGRLMQILQEKVEQKKLFLDAHAATVESLTTKLLATTAELSAIQKARTTEQAKLESDIKTLLEEKAHLEQTTAAHMDNFRKAFNEFEEQSDQANDLLARARTIVMKIKAEAIKRLESGEADVDYSVLEKELQEISGQFNALCANMREQHKSIFESVLQQHRDELQRAADAFLEAFSEIDTVQFEGKQIPSKDFMAKVILYLTEFGPEETAYQWGPTSNHKWETGTFHDVLQKQMYDPVAQTNYKRASLNKKTDLSAVRERFFTACQNVIAFNVAQTSHRANLLTAIKDMYLDMYNTLRDLDLSNQNIVQAAKHQVTSILQNFRVGSIEELQNMLKELTNQMRSTIDGFTDYDDFRKMLQVAHKLGIIAEDKVPVEQQSMLQWAKAGFTSTSRKPTSQDLYFLLDNDPIITQTSEADLIVRNASTKVKNAYKIYARILQLRSALNVLAKLQSYKEQPVRVVSEVLQASLRTSTAEATKALNAQIDQQKEQIQVLQAEAEVTKRQILEMETKQKNANSPSEIERLQQEIETLRKSQNATVKEAVTVARKRQAAQNAQEIALLEERHRKLEANAERARQEANSLALQYQQASEEQRKELEEKFNAMLESEKAAHAKALQAQEEKLQAQEKNLQEMLGSWSQQMTNAQLEIQRLKQTGQSVSESNANIHRLYQELRQIVPHTLSDLQDQLRLVKAQIAEKEEKLAEHKKIENSFNNKWLIAKLLTAAAETMSSSTTVADALYNVSELENEIADLKSQKSNLETIIQTVGEHISEAATEETTGANVSEYKGKIQTLQERSQQDSAKTVEEQVSALETFRTQVQAEMDKQISSMQETLNPNELARFRAALQAHADSVYKAEAEKAVKKIWNAYSVQQKELQQLRETNPQTKELTGKVNITDLERRNAELESKLTELTEKLKQQSQLSPTVSDQTPLENMLREKEVLAGEVATLQAQMQQMQSDHAAKVEEIKRISAEALEAKEFECAKKLGVADPESREYFFKHLGTTDFDKVVQTAHDGEQSILWLLKQALLYKNSKYYFDRSEAVDANLLQTWVTLYKIAVTTPTTKTNCRDNKTVENCLVHGNTCMYEGSSKQCKPYADFKEIINGNSELTKFLNQTNKWTL